MTTSQRYPPRHTFPLAVFAQYQKQAFQVYSLEGNLELVNFPAMQLSWITSFDPNYDTYPFLEAPIYQVGDAQVAGFGFIKQVTKMKIGVYGVKETKIFLPWIFLSRIIVCRTYKTKQKGKSIKNIRNTDQNCFRLLFPCSSIQPSKSEYRKRGNEFTFNVFNFEDETTVLL